MNDFSVRDSISLKVCLLEAVRDWIVDHNMTPYVIVDAKHALAVPAEFITGGKIVLNVHPQAVHQYGMDGEILRFAARFRGQSRQLEIPAIAILAVYAKENGEGISFPRIADVAPDPKQPTPPAKTKSTAKKRSRAQLRIVK